MGPKIPQELEYLFSWNPPQLVLPGQKMSTKTRSPKYFDKHFHESLQLLHVKPLPTLVRDIAAIVDASIADGVQLPSNTVFSKAAINTLVEIAGTEMSDEKAVASFYERTTATICISTASFLALQVPLLLNWSQSSNVSGYAIAHGFIRFVSPRVSVDKYAELELLMGEEAKHIRALADKVSSLATFEFKNMAAGGPEVMLAIPRLTTLPRFDWTTCNTPECATMSTHAKERGKAAEAEARIEFDATTTPWALPPINSVSPKVQDGLEYVGTGSKRKREEEIGDQTMASSLLSTLVPSHQSFLSGPSLVLSRNSIIGNTSRP